TATIHYLWAVKKDTFVPILYFGIFATLLGFRLIWRPRPPSPAKPECTFMTTRTGVVRDRTQLMAR
ncbi:MAG: hypothetical protein ABJB74_13270, partial [Gemmatimonas sp.]